MPCTISAEIKLIEMNQARVFGGEKQQLFETQLIELKVVTAQFRFEALRLGLIRHVSSIVTSPNLRRL